jgi:hypothetical protein
MEEWYFFEVLPENLSDQDLEPLHPEGLDLVFRFLTLPNLLWHH